MKRSINRQTEGGVEVIESLDLNPVVFRLIDVDDGPGWSLEKACSVEKRYRQFLMLHVHYNDDCARFVPDSDVDEFWHYHILDTRKYYEDCVSIFGAVLHHYPYLGKRNQEDIARLASNFAETKALLASHFGPETSPSDPSVCGSACAGACGGNIRFGSNEWRPTQEDVMRLAARLSPDLRRADPLSKQN
jgi:hypothetical protein